MNSIATARQSIESEIETLRKFLKALQEKCKHKNLETKYGSNSGNYDPSADCYWIDYYCPDCNKKWRVYQ